MEHQATGETIALILTPKEARDLLDALPVVLANPTLAKIERALVWFVGEK